jgi:hypothetical protein
MQPTLCSKHWKHEIFIPQRFEDAGNGVIEEKLHVVAEAT